MKNKKFIIIGIAVLISIACAIAAIYTFSNNNSVLPEYNINDIENSTTTPYTENFTKSEISTTLKNILDTTLDTLSSASSTNQLTSASTSISSTRKEETFLPSKFETTTLSNNNHTEVTSSVQTSTEKQPVVNLQDILSENQVVGFRYDAENEFYYADDKDCWQSHAGYNELYDHMASGVGMYIDQLRIRFSHEGQDWMIESWKGQYGLFVGGEVGVYTAPEGTYKGNPGDVNHYNCADEKDWLPMEMSCYWAKNNSGNYRKIFTRTYDKYWWATGFVKGSLTKYTSPRTELKIKNRITFKSEEMALKFYNGLLEAGFKTSNNPNLLTNDSCYINGCDVYYLWYSIHQQSFANYNP